MKCLDETINQDLKYMLVLKYRKNEIDFLKIFEYLGPQNENEKNGRN